MQGHFSRIITEVALRLVSEEKQFKIISRNSKRKSLRNEEGIYTVYILGGSTAHQ